MEEEIIEMGERLKNLRIMNNYTQNQVASFLKIDQGHLSNIENGKKNTTIDIVEKLCDLYNCSIEYLLGETDYYEAPKIAFGGNRNNNDLHLVCKMNEIMKNINFLVECGEDEGQ